MSTTLELELFQQQSRAMQCPAEEILYGGAAGGGKSHLLRGALITWALAVPGLQLYLFRRLYPDLVRNHLEGPSNFHIMLADLVRAGRAAIVKGEIRFDNGSKIYLRHLQHTKDIYSYQGAEIHVLAFDEGTHFTDQEYRYLRGRCRVVGLKIPAGCPWIFPRVLICTNPGGVGHHWAKSGFIDHGPYVIHRASKADGGMRRCFIPAKIEDNPALLKDDPDYLDRLEGLGDPDLVRAMKDGDWTVIAGAMFSGTWRQTRHVVKPFTIPVDWPIWIGGDDGYAAPAAVVWMTENPATKRQYIIRELYKAGMLPQSFAEQIKAIQRGILRSTGRAAELEETVDPPTGSFDSAAFADTGTEAIPRGKQLRKLGIRIKPVKKWQGSRVQGCQNLHRMLAPLPSDPNRGPALQVFDCCPNVIRTVPALMRDADNPEDVDTDGEDHLYDAIRYALQHRPSTAGRVKVKGT